MSFGLFAQGLKKIEIVDAPSSQDIDDILEFPSPPGGEELDEANEHEIDALYRIQKRFEKKAELFEEELKYWQDEKIKILASNNKLIDENKQQESSTAKEKFINFLNEVGSFFETPKFYLNHLIDHTMPKITQLNENLNDLTSELSNPKNSNEALQKIRLNICDTNIAMINSFQAICNNINREVDYCLKWVNTLERLVVTLIVTTARIKIDVPDIDLGIGKRYRMTLYNSIHAPMEKIFNFMVNVQGMIERSKKALTTRTNHSFAFFRKKPKVAIHNDHNDHKVPAVAKRHQA